MRLKSMYALRIGELIGSVRSRMSTMRIARQIGVTNPFLPTLMRSTSSPAWPSASP